MKRIIVTGAGGYLGKMLVKKLLLEGHHVTAVDYQIAALEDLSSDRLIPLKVDLNCENVQEFFPEGEYDSFYHLAWLGVNGPMKADPMIQWNNVKMALRCAQLAKSFGCKKFLCSGTIAERAVESLPHLEKTSGGMLYGAAKHSCHTMLETYCKNAGLNLVWMQFSNCFGPTNLTGNLISYTIEQLNNGTPALFGPALQPYDFIYTDDLIEAVSRLGVMPNSTHCYFLGSGSPEVLRDYLITIGRLSGKPELIRIGERPDDGIRYDWSMLDNASLVKDIGPYVTGTFEEKILYTLKNYKGGRK